MAPQEQLFRGEVLQATARDWMGGVSLARPMSSWTITGLAVAAIACAFAYSIWGTIAKRSQVRGVVVSSLGSISVQSSVSGVFAKTLVKEGEYVEAGQTLFEIVADHKNDMGDVAELMSRQLISRKESLEKELEAKKILAIERQRSLQAQLKVTNQEAEQLTNEITLMKRREHLANESIRKYQALSSSGFVSGAQVQQRQEELIDISAKLLALERNQLQLSSNKSGLTSEVASLRASVVSEQAQMDRARAAIDQELIENGSRRSISVKATQSGFLKTINGQLGQFTAAGQTIATLVAAPDCTPSGGRARCQYPTTALQVHLYAPSKMLGFVEAGQPVRLRYQAYPYQKFGAQAGTILDVSETPITASELPSAVAAMIVSASPQGLPIEPVYRIKVRLDSTTIFANGKQHDLRLGMAVDADIVHSRQQVWEWLFAPLLAISRS